MSVVAETRAGHPWTDAEGAQARRMRIGGETVDAIARRLG